MRVNHFFTGSFLKSKEEENEKAFIEWQTGNSSHVKVKKKITGGQK